MLVRDATVSRNFLPIKWSVRFFDEINGELIKLISFCGLSMLNFEIKSDFVLKQNRGHNENKAFCLFSVIPAI